MTSSQKKLNWIILIFALVKISMHLPAILFEGYGIFRDELYYLACTSHPAAGYVDQPPLSIWVLSAWIQVFGDSWQSIRIVPALFGGLTMIVLLQWTRALNGKFLAVVIVGTAFLAAPINIAFGSFYSMNSIDLFFWSLCFYSGQVVFMHPDRALYWAILGLAVGLGLMNKISIAWFAIGLIVFILISNNRILLLKKEPYIAGLTALFLFTPFIFWNMQHDWAHLTFASNASATKYAGISRMDFIAGIFLLENPVSMLLIIPAFAFLFNRKFTLAKRYAMVIFVTTLLILLVKGNVKSEYLAGSFLAVFVAGAVQAELWFGANRLRYAVFGFVFVVAISGLVLLPLASPVLDEDAFINYQQQLGMSTRNSEGKEEAQLPQFYADMHGWKGLAENVSAAYMSIPEDNWPSTAVWASNYGEAGAIDYFRKNMPLPPVLSPHNNYYLWSLELAYRQDFNTFIILGGSAEDHSRFLKKVKQVGTFTCEYCMPYENNMPIFIGSDPRNGKNIHEIIKMERNYN